MIESIKFNWQAYAMETFGLAGFVVGAGLLAILLEHPDMPIMQSSLGKHALLRRIPLGIIMGGYITAVVLLFGKKSGAHINPAVTWIFFRLGKIDFTHALMYTLAQFAGAIAGAQLLKLTVGKWFSDPAINFGNTAPKPPHASPGAFIAEFIISFIMMLVVLMASSSKRFEKYVAILSGLIIALYLIFELPFSGMSLNPARSFAAALASYNWKHLWIYFVAPPLGMLCAGEIYLLWEKKQLYKIKKLTTAQPGINIFSDYKKITNYPIVKKV